MKFKKLLLINLSIVYLILPIAFKPQITHMFVKVTDPQIGVKYANVSIMLFVIVGAINLIVICGKTIIQNREKFNQIKQAKINERNDSNVYSNSNPKNSR